MPTSHTSAASLPSVQAGSFLTLHYRLSGPAGDVINTFADKPATLSLGTGELSPAVEQRLLGLCEGTRATFELPAGEAFGDDLGTRHGGQQAVDGLLHGVDVRDRKSVV